MAALLQARRKLLEEAFRLRALPLPATCEISAQHPDFSLLAWVLRAEESPAPGQGSSVGLVLRSPPVAELDSSQPFLLRTLEFDLEGDGTAETVGAGYDGRVFVLRGSRVLGVTPGLASMRCSLGPGWEQVLLTRLESIESVERAGAGRLRVVATLSTHEAVNGIYLGGTWERREVLLDLEKPGPPPRIEIQEPADFQRTPRPRLPLKGLLVAPAGILRARLWLNGEKLWESPPGLASRQLRLDLELPLVPGSNNARLELEDGEKRRVEREIHLERLSAAPVAGELWAVLVGIDSYQDGAIPGLRQAEADARALQEYLAGQVPGRRLRLLLGPQATRQAIAAALAESAREASGRDLLLFYFAGRSTAGGPGGAKYLLPFDARPEEGFITARDLALWLGRRRALVLLDTAGDEGPAPGRWADGHYFWAALAGPGRVLLASGDPPAAEREDGSGGRLTRQLLQFLAGSKGFVEAEEAYRSLFVSAARSGLACLPLWRGSALGRVGLPGGEAAPVESALPTPQPLP
jgi:hypothetical protein